MAKIFITLLIGMALGAALVFVGLHLHGGSSGSTDFAALHSRLAGNGSLSTGQSDSPSDAVLLMQTDTALCDQPYFVALYELSADYFARGIDNADAGEFAEIVFDHARNSGFFTAEETEGWIDHISAIPGQMVEIYRNDPTALDTCYNFQVAAVGPPN